MLGDAYLILPTLDKKDYQEAEKVCFAHVSDPASMLES